MNKKFTKDDILKKYETNLKSAVSGFALAGILGLIYIIRYFIKEDFDFYFSLSVPEIMLKLSHAGEIGKAVAYAVVAVFVAAYILLAILNVKDQKWLRASLVFYGADFVCLLGYIFLLMHKPVDSAVYIEVVVHFFVILFLSVGVYSNKKYKELKG